MKNFIVKLMVFSFILFGIGIIIQLIYPYSNYSNPYLKRKTNYLSETKTNFDVIFIGSSRINNQIDCKIVDSLIGKTKSYNLGSNASFFLESENTLKYILNETQQKPKVIVLELQQKFNVTRVNLFSDRNYNAHNLTNFPFILKYHIEKKNIKQIGMSFFSFVVNNFHYNKTLHTKEYSDIIIKSQAGFSPLENENQSERHTKLLNDTLEIQRRVKKFENDSREYKVSNAFVNEMYILNELCKRKNIKLILLIPAPLEPDGKELTVYKDKLKIPILDYSSPKLKQYYQIKNRFDYGHLNTKGSELFSQQLANDLKKIIYK